VLGHVAPVPWLATGAASALIKTAVGETAAASVAMPPSQGATPLSGNAYKVQMVKNRRENAPCSRRRQPDWRTLWKTPQTSETPSAEVQLPCRHLRCKEMYYQAFRRRRVRRRRLLVYENAGTIRSGRRSLRQKAMLRQPHMLRNVSK